MGDVGKGLGIIRHSRDVHKPTDVRTAGTNEHTYPRRLTGNLSLGWEFSLGG
jgi:hypothetical protein